MLRDEDRRSRETTVVGGRFVLGALIQRRAGVETWAAVDGECGQPVVVKIVGAGALDESARQRIALELAARARLGCEWLVPVLAAGDEGGRPYLVTPRLAGETLAARLAAGGALGVDDAFTVGRCLLEALVEVHDSDLLHGDVKPAKLVVQGAPITAATLIDFSLAACGADPSLAHRAPDAVADPALYMAPEQVGLLHSEVDHRADLYGAGAVLYEALAGRPPFCAATRGELLRQQLDGEPPGLQLTRPPSAPRVPPALEALVLRLLAKQPRDRYQCARAALADLEAIARAVQRGGGLPGRASPGSAAAAQTPATPSTVGPLEATREKLVQAAKLAAIGELGAGVVHELSQPVAAIKGFAERLLRRGDDPIERWAGELELILNASRRMGDMLDRVRTFAHEAPPVCARIDPLAPLHEALLLVGGELERDGACVRRELTPVPQVEADPVRLQQVFLNLLLNARAALEQRDRDLPRQLLLRSSHEDGVVRVSVIDNGPGVPEEHRARIFESFFTTKPAGLGLGLGLSITRKLVEQHGGWLTYEPAPDGGAAFTVCLPVAAPAEP